MSGRRIKFERRPSRVVFDPDCGEFVVTWSKCNLPLKDRLAAKRDSRKWLPSIDAIVSLYARGGQPIQAVPLAIAKAWDAGDREGLDTDKAKKAAELIRDLAYKDLAYKNWKLDSRK